VLCTDHDVRTMHADLDLPPFADRADLVGIIAERVLTAKLFGDAGESRLQIVDRIRLEFPSARLLCEIKKVLPSAFVLGTSPAARSTASNLYASASNDRAENVAHCDASILTAGCGHSHTAAGQISRSIEADRIEKRV